MRKVTLILMRVALGTGVLTLVITATLFILARGVKCPANLGVRNGHLAPCPSSPNCVSTQSDDERHTVAPIPYTTSTEEARERVLQIIHSLERTTLVTQESHYIHVEFRTPGMGYVDDVEFYFDEEAGVLHFRSASRLPYWDWGVNRERMENFRGLFNQK